MYHEFGIIYNQKINNIITKKIEGKKINIIEKILLKKMFDYEPKKYKIIKFNDNYFYTLNFLKFKSIVNSKTFEGNGFEQYYITIIHYTNFNLIKNSLKKLLKENKIVDVHEIQELIKLFEEADTNKKSIIHYGI